MKFTVREGFVVHDKKIIEIGGQNQVQESSYFEGQQVDFDKDTAEQHLHKLEPIDKEARLFVDSKHPLPAVVPTAGQIDYAALATAMVAAMAAAQAAPPVAT